MTNTKLNAGRLEKQLDKLYKDSDTGEIYNLRTRILNNFFDKVESQTITHSQKRIELEYRKLKNPKTEYLLRHRENNNNYTQVPKLVAVYFDTLSELEKIKQNPNLVKKYCSESEYKELFKQ